MENKETLIECIHLNIPQTHANNTLCPRLLNELKEPSKKFQESSKLGFDKWQHLATVESQEMHEQ